MTKSKMIHCSECGKEMAKSAKACPSCGAKNKKARSGCSIAIGILFLMIGGCWMAMDGMRGAASSSEPAKVYGMNEPASIDNAEWTITYAEAGSSFLYFTVFDSEEWAQAGSDETSLIKVKGKLVNRGKEQVSAFGNIKLVDADGNEYGKHDSCAMMKGNLALESLNPNVPQTFVAIFEVPKSASDLKFAGSTFNMFSNRKVLIELRSE